MENQSPYIAVSRLYIKSQPDIKRANQSPETWLYIFVIIGILVIS